MTVLDATFPASLTDPTDFLLVFKDSVWTSPRRAVDPGGGRARAVAVAGHGRGQRSPRPPRAPVDYNAVRLAYRLLGAPKGLAATPPPTLPPEISEADQLYRAIGQYVKAHGRTVRFATAWPPAIRATPPR